MKFLHFWLFSRFVENKIRATFFFIPLPNNRRTAKARSRYPHPVRILRCSLPEPDAGIRHYVHHGLKLVALNYSYTVTSCPYKLFEFMF